MTFVVGLTGGIGSGKTLISDRFNELEVPVIDTDVIAREIVEPGRPALADLAQFFGPEIIAGDGRLDRDKLRELAFSSATNKNKLDQITHPAILRETIQQVKEVQYPYCVVVIPLLTAESNFTSFLHRVITVTADERIRITRVMKRNDLSEQEVVRIIRSQLSDAQRLEFADDVIDNSGSKSDALSQADQLHLLYLDLSRKTDNRSA